MDRRDFIRSAGGTGLLAACRIPTGHPPVNARTQPALMKLGDQTHPTNDTHLKYLARYGVRNICGYPEIQGDRIYATVDELNRLVTLRGRTVSASTVLLRLFWSLLTSTRRSIPRSCWP